MEVVSILSSLQKKANATGFYCNTHNFVAIRRFSTMSGDFGCVSMPCCHKNFSVALKFKSLQQGGVFATKQ